MRCILLILLVTLHIIASQSKGVVQLHRSSLAMVEEVSGEVVGPNGEVQTLKTIRFRTQRDEVCSSIPLC